MKNLVIPVFVLVLAFTSCKLNKEEVLPVNTQNVNKNGKKLYTQEELAKIIEKFNAVPMSSNNNERRLESSQGYMYCDGQCAFIVNTYSYNLFGTTLWTSSEVIQVPQADGGECPCGNVGN